MLEFRNVVKKFGEHTAVSNVSFTVGSGELFSILGPSGCGKTTLLRMIAGFEKPTSGEILFEGRRLDEIPAYQRPVNMVFQKYALFPHLSVKQNVAFGLEMKNVPPSEIISRVDALLSLVQMDSFADRHISTLSGGQQQRVALGRALINRPKILLLDEPLSALDLKLRQQMQFELLALQRKIKTTFIFVTHDQDEALTLSDRVAVMKKGHLEQIGSSQEIYEYPKTSFVAQFIGSINHFKVQIQARDHEKVMVNSNGLTAGRVICVRSARDGVRPLPEVQTGSVGQLMIRPEKMRLLKSPARSEGAIEHNYFEGILREALYHGPVTQFWVEPTHSAMHGSETKSVLVVQANSAVSSKKQFHLGEKVFVSWSSQDSVLIAGDSPSV